MRPATRIAVVVGVLAGMVLALDACLVTPRGVAGPSMRPALREGDRVLVDRWTYRQRAPRPGELVLLDGPDGSPLVKRVARDPYGREGTTAGAVWVVGDNRARSVDSRRFGSLEPQRIRGRVVLRYWPPSRAGPVR